MKIKKMLTPFIAMIAIVLAAGTWTDDFTAAQKTSKEKNLPVLLNFTGADWCYWCKLMDAKVFSKKDWDEWSGKNVVAVIANFPRDDSKISEKVRKQNNDLAEKFKIRGFPTYVLLAPGGEKELGRVMCPGKNVTPEMFIDIVKGVIDKKAPAAK